MKARLTSGFWADRQAVNARQAIFHQWEQLVASGCIENFRIAAGEVEGFREGWFFADSDAYKWLDAAARIHAAFPDTRLAALMNGFIALIGRAQQADGYIFTYNQVHFPTQRWQNLQIEHELYCHGHLIEAGVSHFESTGREDLLTIARRAADRIAADFLGKGPQHTPGHEEIEIALLRLYRATNHQPYLDMARQFIEQRGRNPFFALSILRQNGSVEARSRLVREKKQAYLAAHPDFKPFQLPPGNAAKKPANSALRWYASALSGKYFQQHAPIRRQTVPVGHSVRFAYLETAAALLARLSGDRSGLPAMQQAWERMVTRRMYVTGGIGSLPSLEGFGNDYELDPEYAYAETCAALASLFWNWEMAQLTGSAQYGDLFEWQLYNAAAVGMGLDGTTYLYNNPLTCRGGVTRKPWFAVPCCPSNLSRTWADLGRYAVSAEAEEICLHQYISGTYEDTLASVTVESALPWQGQVRIRLAPPAPGEFTVRLRMPSWCDPGAARLTCCGEAVPIPPPPRPAEQSASGYDPRRSRWLSLRRAWQPGDMITLDFDLPIRLLRAHPKVKDHQGKVTVTRGPLVYCLESCDNPGVDLFSARLDPNTLAAVEDGILGGIVKINGRTTTGQPLALIPYHLWGNRGASTMTVWISQ